MMHCRGRRCRMDKLISLARSGAEKALDAAQPYPAPVQFSIEPSARYH